MKKILSAIVCIAMLVSAFVFTGTVSAEDPAATLEVIASSAAPGENFTVEVYLRNNPGVWCLKMFLYFDPAITCVSAANGTVFANNEFQAAKNLNLPAATTPNARVSFDDKGIDPGNFNSACIYFLNNEDADNTESGLLATFTMTAPAEPGTYFIGVIDAYGDVLNWDDDDVALALVNSTLTVESAVQVLIGDVDGDNDVNLKDINALKKYVASQLTDEDIIVANSDVDGDGDINIKDILELKRIIASAV